MNSTFSVKSCCMSCLISFFLFILIVSLVDARIVRNNLKWYEKNASSVLNGEWLLYEMRKPSLSEPYKIYKIGGFSMKTSKDGLFSATIDGDAKLMFGRSDESYSATNCVIHGKYEVEVDYKMKTVNVHFDNWAFGLLLEDFDGDFYIDYFWPDEVNDHFLRLYKGNANVDPEKKR